MALPYKLGSNGAEITAWGHDNGGRGRCPVDRGHGRFDGADGQWFSRWWWWSRFITFYWISWYFKH